MVKADKTFLLILISILLLSQGSVSAKINTSMIGVKKYQKFDYLQTKFIGNFHPFFWVEQIDHRLSVGIMSRENHIFSLKILEITVTDEESSVNCEFIKDNMQAYVFHSFHLDQLLIDSAFIYVDWEYWVSYLNEIASNSNATTTKFEIYNDDNFFGYKYEYNWVDPSNDSIFENQLKTVIYDKQRGNIVNFDYSLNLTNSVQEIENAYSYQFVSVSMDLALMTSYETHIL